jgi:hypothetical protein
MNKYEWSESIINILKEAIELIESSKEKPVSVESTYELFDAEYLIFDAYQKIKRCISEN